MIFSSYQFIFLFLPVVLLGYHLLRHWGNVAGMKGWLVLASLVFYGLGQPEFVLGFLGIILVNYLLVTLLHRVERTAARRLLLAAAVLLNLGLLGYYKYANFFLENLNLVLGTDFALLSTIRFTQPFREPIASPFSPSRSSCTPFPFTGGSAAISPFWTTPCSSPSSPS